MLVGEFRCGGSRLGILWPCVFRIALLRCLTTRLDVDDRGGYCWLVDRFGFCSRACEVQEFVAADDKEKREPDFDI